MQHLGHELFLFFFSSVYHSYHMVVKCECRTWKNYLSSKSESTDFKERFASRWARKSNKGNQIGEREISVFFRFTFDYNNVLLLLLLPPVWHMLCMLDHVSLLMCVLVSFTCIICVCACVSQSDVRHAAWVRSRQHYKREIQAYLNIWCTMFNYASGQPPIPSVLRSSSLSPGK